MYKSFVQALSGSMALPEVCGICRDVCEHYGFEHYSYTAKVPTSLVSPQYLLIESSMSTAQTLVDTRAPKPVYSQLMRTTTPINWRQKQLLPDEIRAASILAREASIRGYHNGVSVPIQTNLAGSALMKFSTRLPGHKVTEEIERNTPELNLLAMHTHQAISKFIRYHDYEAGLRKISSRERQCLLWTTEGLTTIEIGKKLDVAASTVTFHLQNVMRKLNASNRQQAVAKAIMLGVI